jgi:hypothetical protein
MLAQNPNRHSWFVLHRPEFFLSVVHLHITSERYKFSQKFDVPASKAFKWLTDYDSGDHQLMGEDGSRSIERLSDDTIILRDSYTKNGETFTKEKLVRLYPERLQWVSTHVSGPAKHSQFMYEIHPTGKSSCRIDFTGLQIDYNEVQATKREIAVRAAQLRKEDSGAWKLLAKALHKDLKK